MEPGGWGQNLPPADQGGGVVDNCDEGLDMRKVCKSKTIWGPQAAEA